MSGAGFSVWSAKDERPSGEIVAVFTSFSRAGAGEEGGGERSREEVETRAGRKWRKRGSEQWPRGEARRAKQGGAKRSCGCRKLRCIGGGSTDMVEGGTENEGGVVAEGDQLVRPTRPFAGAAACARLLERCWTAKGDLVSQTQSGKERRNAREALDSMRRRADLIHLGIRCPDPSLSLLHACSRSDDIVLRRQAS